MSLVAVIIYGAGYCCCTTVSPWNKQEWQPVLNSITGVERIGLSSVMAEGH